MRSLLLADDQITRTISAFTLEEKVGQLLMIGFHGKSQSKKDAAHLRRINPGGIIFYGRNFSSAVDITSDIAKIKKILKDQKVPLFFAIDQEGGIVHRIEEENYNPPSAPAIGATDSAALAKAVGQSTGYALRELGINFNLAPVLDIPSDIRSSLNPGRSFSDNPERVARLGIAYINGLREAGVLATAKHFPGIGRAEEDSHKVLPRIVWKGQQERDSDLFPFQQASNWGVDAIMVGHVIAEPGDGKNPASLSPFWMNNILREKFGFQGLVLIDNIEMKSVQEFMDAGNGAVQSFLAGADIILVSHEKNTQEEVYTALLKAAQKGDIPLKRINESLRRILIAKKRLQSINVPDFIGKGLRFVSYAVAEESIIAIKREEAPVITIGNEQRILYAGFNKNAFEGFSGIYKHTDILNTTASNFKQMNPRKSLEQLIQGYDLIVIDSEYPDAVEIAAICNRSHLNSIMVSSNIWNIEKKLQVFKPQYLYLSPENRSIYFSTIAKILNGVRQAKGILPYSSVLPPDYEYMPMDRK
jgi:beta-N-acetylhexosaminidase